MTETSSINQSHSQLKNSSIKSSIKISSNKNNLNKFLSSSSLDSSFENINYEIKSIIENENDLSFSSESNSELAETKANMEYLFDHKYWKAHSNSKDSDSKEKTKKINSSIHVLKISNNQAVISDGSNKQSTQSNDDEEGLQNVSSFESNYNSSFHNESTEKEKSNEIIKKEKENIPVNKKSNNNISSFNYNNKINENEFIYPYEHLNFKNNNVRLFPRVFFPTQIYPFMQSYNFPSLNGKNFIQNHNNFLTDELEGNNIYDKNEQIKSNQSNKIQNQHIYPYLNNMNNLQKKISQSQMDIKDLPQVINNAHNNTINYPCQKINFNMICCPKIQPVNTQFQKQTSDKINTSSNFLPEINHRENSNLKTSNQEKKNINNNNINNNNSTVYNNSNNRNACPIMEKGNNDIKINNKNFVNNKSNNINNKGNLKGEKQFLNLDDIVNGKDTRTTVMIRNIPIKYTDQILTEALSEFNGKYDCLYMPYDYEKNGNKGYAFINFVNPLHILYFYEKFNGKKWVHFESSKICELNCAHFQGINEIQKHAKNYKGQKKPNYYSINESENLIIPLKYLPKLQKRFPKMKYIEKKEQNIFTVISFG